LPAESLSPQGGGVNSYEPVRDDIKSLLADIQSKAKSDPAIVAQLDPARGGAYLALVVFVDFMIRASKLSFATQWESLASEEFEEGAEHKFFDMLDQALATRANRVLKGSPFSIPAWGWATPARRSADKRSTCGAKCWSARPASKGELMPTKPTRSVPRPTTPTPGCSQAD